jgi:hypothetical protein
MIRSSELLIIRDAGESSGPTGVNNNRAPNVEKPALNAAVMKRLLSDWYLNSPSIEHRTEANEYRLIDSFSRPVSGSPQFQPIPEPGRATGERQNLIAPSPQCAIAP